MPEIICPTCHRAIAYSCLDEVPFRPFCSSRCKLVDLGRWLNEEYHISEELPDGETADEPRSPSPPPHPDED